MEGRDGVVGEACAALLQGLSVLFSGVAGIGKSTVLGEVVSGVGEPGVRVLRCAPASADVQLPFVSLIDLLSPVGAGVFEGLDPVLRRAVDAALLRGDFPDGQPDPLAVRLGVLQVFRRLLASGPVVVAVDDVQWLDPPSAQVLEFVARRLPGSGLRVVAAGRGTPEEVARFVSLLPEGVRRIEIGPMADETLVPLIVKCGGQALSRMAAVEICRSAQGNPLFALEIASAVARRGAVPVLGEPLPVPSEVRELMVERLGALSQEVRGVLLVAAAVARPSAGLLREAGCVRVVEALGAAREAGVAWLGDDGSVVFSHPLMQSVVYGQAGVAERMDVHRRLADVVKEPVESARHLALSSAVDDEAVAGKLAAAAGVARSRGAIGMAAELARMAADRTPRAEVAARADRLLEAGWYYHAANQIADGRRAAQAVLELEVPRPTRARAQILQLQLTGNLMAKSGDLAEEAIANAEGIPELECHARWMSMWRHFIDGRLDLAFAEAERVLGAVDRAGDAASLIRCFDGLMASLIGFRSARSTQILERALRLARENQGSTTLRLWEIHRHHARFLTKQCRYAEARVAIQEAMRPAQEYGHVTAIANVMHTAILIEIGAGDYRRALELSAELEAIAESMEENQTGWLAGALALAQRTGGDAELSRDAAARGLAVSRRISDWFNIILNGYYLGYAQLMLGDVAGAIEALETSRRQNMSLYMPYALGYPWAPQLAEALLLAGDVARAREIIDLGATAAVARDFDLLGRDTVEQRSDIDRVEALVRAAEGHLDEAARQLKELVARQEGRPPVEVSRTLITLAGIERRRRRRGVARTILDQARELCESSGAAPWLTTIDTELARIDSAHRGEPDSLTAVENRIVALVLDGATNREIAGALSVSVKTVEATLSRIYRKTGARSRIELIKEER